MPNSIEILINVARWNDEESERRRQFGDRRDADRLQRQADRLWKLIFGE